GKMSVFARKASGLSREASLFDAFLLGFLNNGLGVGIWSMHSWGLYTFPGGNMVIGSIIVLALTAFGAALAWGILGGSMPRSGGDYVYNSRIIHPAVGVVTSYAKCFGSLCWSGLLAAWNASPGLVMVGSALGWPEEIISFFDSTTGIYLIGTIAMIISFVVVLLGFKYYLWTQKICVAIGMIGVFIALILLSITPSDVFISRWNALAAEYGSATYQEMITLAEEAGYAPSTWNWTSTLGLMPSISWAVSYGFVIGYIGGEVKRPERNLLMAQVLACLVPALFCIWAGFVLENNLGYKFMGACAYVDNVGPEWYKMPFPPTYANLAAILTDNYLAKFLITFNFVAFNFIWVPMTYVVFSRIMFAQAMDNIGPRWFTDIHPRFNSPLKLYTLFFILGQIVLTLYALAPEWLGGIAIGVFETMIMWGVVGISAMLFPFVKKVRHIWDASPHRWPLAAVMSGIVSLIATGVLLWAYYTSPEMGIINAVWTPIYIGVLISAVLWYYIWRLKRAREGIDVTLAFKELPPE
ncbi:MAG: APC family permease, partial [Candidatus Bathyarchaeia archaeon]